MKTGFDQMDILFEVLTNSALNAAITGQGYKMVRPSSTLEDYVVNSLPVTGDQLQRGKANINLYVADLAQLINGKTCYVPDITRMQELVNLATLALQETATQAYRFYIEAISPPIAEPETNCHYVNLRVDFSHFPS